jgi:hypothetical protein
MSVYVCASLARELLDKFCSSLAFKRLSNIGPCLVNTNILIPNTETLRMGPEEQKFSPQNGYNDFYYSSVIYGHHILK